MYYKKQNSDKPLLLIMRIPWFGLLCALKRFLLLLYVYTFHTVSRQTLGGVVPHIVLPDISLVIRLICVLHYLQNILFIKQTNKDHSGVEF